MESTASGERSAIEAVNCHEIQDKTRQNKDQNVALLMADSV